MNMAKAVLAELWPLDAPQSRRNFLELASSIIGGGHNPLRGGKVRWPSTHTSTHKHTQAHTSTHKHNDALTATLRMNMA